ncbi:3'(2'),5'-bisphosphate nucleotidase CysQ [Croceitalea rosinachiae]|uniref:3'(2'),5'-bisphosphate nucleotidase CysQ n=1 Tax=Croceitalea rosinachiae TaxID=3075596 RepID=A0ABU3AD62_9FLAO|nr:3'(2'),5'-bisphosphate nucleotidase CysQ [Croceitalea sp. F388]MDT0607830.1 3'(2'),5'-bisphosphate nucleotidase CysQ [Croceitalea sp. F388]
MDSKNDFFLAALTASIEAGRAILEVYDKSDYGVTSKEDSSPLTEADLISSKIINEHLTQTPFPIISEEVKTEKKSLRESWTTCWVVDPLDGTKEFIKRNGEFTVNIALCHDGIPISGVIYTPVTRELYYARVKDEVAFKTVLNENHEVTDGFFNERDHIQPSTIDRKKIRIVGSRSHMNEDTIDFMTGLKTKYDAVEIVSKGSSLKFCLVAEGKADIYPRFAPTMEWDTAAGHAICNAVGLKVISQDTNDELLYNKESMLNPYFLVTQ